MINRDQLIGLLCKIIVINTSLFESCASKEEGVNKRVCPNIF